jgi:hypothetical protein
MFNRHSNQPPRLCHLARVGAFCLLFRGLAAFADDGGLLILDRAVAAIGEQVITASALDFETRVIFINEGGVRAATEPLSDDDLLRGLNSMIDYRVATLEADKLEAYPIDQVELEAAVAAFKGRFRSDAQVRDFLGRHEASLDDLRDILRRALRAGRALDGKLRLKAQVSEADARQYVARHPDLASVPIEAVRSKLFAERLRLLVRDELLLARRNAHVRLLGPFAPRTANEPSP